MASQVGKDITVGRQFEPYFTDGALACWWHPCGVAWDAAPEQSWLLAAVNYIRVW